MNGTRWAINATSRESRPPGPDTSPCALWPTLLIEGRTSPQRPEIVLDATDFCIHQAKLKAFNRYGFKAVFNPSHPREPGNPYGWWVSPWHFGLNQGPIVLMIEKLAALEDLHKAKAPPPIEVNERARFALHDPTIRARLEQLCIQNSKSSDQSLPCE